MRNVILSFLAIFAVISSSAQKFELGVNGGVGFNSSFTTSAPQYTYIWQNAPAAKQSAATSLKAMYNFRRWQCGLAVDERYASYRLRPTGGTVCWGVPATMTAQQWADLLKQMSETEFLTREGASSYKPVQLFLNRKFFLRRFEMYAGISGGYIFIPGLKKDSEFSGDNSNGAILKARDPFRKNGDYGLCAGIRGGGTYFFSKHFGMNAELGADYLQFQQITVSMHSASFPCTLGIRYKL